jgi:hypothetical protein
VWLHNWGDLIWAHNIKRGDQKEKVYTSGACSCNTKPQGSLARRKQSSIMHSPALLCCLVLLAGVGASRGKHTQSEDSCTRFPGNLPHMLRDLRAAFGRVKIFFVSMTSIHPFFRTETA